MREVNPADSWMVLKRHGFYLVVIEGQNEWSLKKKLLHRCGIKHPDPISSQFSSHK